MLRTLSDTARLQNRSALTCSCLNNSRDASWSDSNGKCALNFVGRHTSPVQAASPKSQTPSPKPLFWTPRPAMPNFLSRLRYMLRAVPGRAGSATSSASSAAARVHSQRQKILCVSHDAGFFGAQILVLHKAPRACKASPRSATRHGTLQKSCRCRNTFGRATRCRQTPPTRSRPCANSLLITSSSTRPISP